MRLGLHTYSLYLHGIGQDWAGFELPWERQLSTFQLFDLGLEWGLEGFHLDDGCLETLEPSFLREVRSAARERGLFLEYNFSLDLGGLGIGKHQTIQEGIETARILGAEVMKVGMDFSRSRPVSASRFHPRVMEFLNQTVEALRGGLPTAREAGIRLALENHCDSFSQEVLWVIDQVDNPLVGTCLDTVNAWHVSEDPRQAAENLAPRAFTCHFRDDAVSYDRDGFRVSGTACGQGDIDLEYAYRLLRDESRCDNINIETEMGFSLDDKEAALRGEVRAIKESIRYCREVLGVGRERA